MTHVNFSLHRAYGHTLRGYIQQYLQWPVRGGKDEEFAVDGAKLGREKIPGGNNSDKVQKARSACGLPCSSFLIFGINLEPHPIDLHGFYIVELGKTIRNRDIPQSVFSLVSHIDTHSKRIQFLEIEVFIAEGEVNLHKICSIGNGASSHRFWIKAMVLVRLIYGGHKGSMSLTKLNLQPEPRISDRCYQWRLIDPLKIQHSQIIPGNSLT